MPGEEQLRAATCRFELEAAATLFEFCELGRIVNDLGSAICGGRVFLRVREACCHQKAYEGKDLKAESFHGCYFLLDFVFLLFLAGFVRRLFVFLAALGFFAPFGWSFLVK